MSRNRAQPALWDVVYNTSCNSTSMAASGLPITFSQVTTKWLSPGVQLLWCCKLHAWLVVGWLMAIHQAWVLHHACLLSCLPAGVWRGW